MVSSWSRRALLAGVGTVSLVGLPGCRTFSDEEIPRLTVTNHDNKQYRLAVYTVPDANTPGEIPFRATNSGGERRYTSPEELQSGTTYRNVTVTEEDSQLHTHAVASGDTTSITIDGWGRGDAIVYLIDTADSRKYLVALEIMTCENPGQTTSLTIKNGDKTQTSSRCP